MRQKIKVGLVVAAVAAMQSLAFAGTVSVNTQTHSLEGLGGVTADQTSNSIGYTLGAAYAAGDKITFTFPDVLGSSYTFPTVINVPAVDGSIANAIAGLNLGQLNSGATSVTYRVTAVIQPSQENGTPHTGVSTSGALLTFGTIAYTAAGVSAGAIAVTVASETSVGDVMDATGVLTGTIAQATTQFGIVTVSTPFDGVIDVSAARKAFVLDSSDAMIWSIEHPDTTNWLNLATVVSTDISLYGEAGKMTGLEESNFSSASTSPAGTLTFTEAAARLAISFSGQVVSDTITFTPTVGANADVLEAQEFTTDAVYNYTSFASVAGSSIIGSNLASGEWTLNGATIFIPYMPYSATASQIMYVTNAGNQAGAIEVSAFDDNGNNYELGEIKTANAHTVTKITSEVNRALESKGFTGGKVALTITVNAPVDDITVYASYNAGGVRGYVQTYDISQ